MVLLNLKDILNRIKSQILMQNNEDHKYIQILKIYKIPNLNEITFFHSQKYKMAEANNTKASYCITTEKFKK